MQSTQGKNVVKIISSLVLSSIIVISSFLIFKATSPEDSGSIIRRISILLGGNISQGGYIQFMTFFAFFWALLEVLDHLKMINEEKKVYQAKLLPTNDKHLFLIRDVIDLQVQVAEYEKKIKRKTLISSLIRRVCNKFRSSQSVPEILEIISIQTEINKEKAESEQSTIRYLAWVIPSIGFIGTVLGISQALAVANSADMNLITATLGVAFDTTLVSLILSIIIMWYVHELQRETDNLHAGIKEYVIEKLVNKIEVS